MKIGDKIRVVKTGRIGWILKEIGDSWQVDFIDGDKPELVKKSVFLEVINGELNHNPKPNSRPKKRMNWKYIAWTIGIALFLAAALYITFTNVL